MYVTYECVYICVCVYKTILMVKKNVCAYIIYHTNYIERSYVTKWVITEFLARVEVFLLAFKLDHVFEFG